MSRLAVLFVLLFSNIAYAEPLMRLEPQTFLPEQISEDVKISGAYLTGVMFADAPPLEERPSLWARVPGGAEGWGGSKVCMRAMTIDGTYQIANHYQIPSNWSKSDVIDFEYVTAFKDLLTKATSPRFAVSIAKGDCADESTDFLVGYWNATDVDDRLPVVLLLNSLGADEARVYVGDDPSADAILCEPIKSDRPRAFNKRCLVPAAELTDGTINIEINTETGGVLDPPRFVKIQLPVVK